MSEVEETNPLENMIDFAANADFNKANDAFNDILMTKVHNAMEQEKVAMAQSMWADASDESEESDEPEEEMEFSDEDLEAAATDAAEDEDFEAEEEQLRS